MKTFEEAIALTIRSVNSREELAKAEAEMGEVFARYDELANQALTNPDFTMMLTKWIDLGCDDPRSALFTAFITGLVCGIEMEKPFEESSSDVRR